MLDYNIIVSKIKVLLLYYIYFQINTIAKGLNFLSPSYGLNSILTVLL